MADKSENSSHEGKLISNEMASLISARPHWIIRNANSIFFIILLVLLVLSNIIQYPDVIKGSVQLVAINAPKLVVAKSEGKLQKLLVDNEQGVKVGQPLAFIQSLADHTQILRLQKYTDSIASYILKDSLELLSVMPSPHFNNLGEIQAPYEQFEMSLNETRQVLGHGYYQKRKEVLSQDLNYLRALHGNALNQKSLLQQDYDLQEIEYKAMQSLAKDKVIAPLELNQNKSKILSKRQNVKQIEAQVINDNIATQNKTKEILELQKYLTDQQYKLRSALSNLKSQIDQWIQTYIIIAPEDGKVLYCSFLQQNQLISTGQKVFYVQPQSSKYYGQMLTSQTGFGKIKPKQKVLIKLIGYPSTEFGYLTGNVEYISNIPTINDSFLIKISLPNDLRTNYNKTILFRNNLDAVAETITDNRTLFDRFLGELGNIIKR